LKTRFGIVSFKS